MVGKVYSVKDFLRQVSTVASIGTTLASVASVGLGTAGSFHGRSDNATIVMIITASKWFAWSASLFTISLFSALAGLYALDVAVIVRVIQDVTHGWASKCLQYLLMIGGIVINAFMFVTIVLVSLGLNTLVGGSGTVVHWSLFYNIMASVTVLGCLYLSKNNRPKNKLLTFRLFILKKANPMHNYLICTDYITINP